MSRHSDRDPRRRAFDVTSRDAAMSRRTFVACGTAAAAAAVLPARALAQPADAGRDLGTRFRRIPTQFIAALGERDATSGRNAERWGLWRRDPGPRGVPLDRYDELAAAGGRAPAGWRFDGDAWWLEEHGLIMEPPEFPLPVGKYMVTGNRDVKSVLTIEAGGDGTRRWSLADGATLHDVTHLRCRSARYTPATPESTCSPAEAKPSEFPVEPGAPMPPVAGCDKQDFAVLIVLGVAVDDAASA